MPQQQSPQREMIRMQSWRKLISVWTHSSLSHTNTYTLLHPTHTLYEQIARSNSRHMQETHLEGVNRWNCLQWMCILYSQHFQFLQSVGWQSLDGGARKISKVQQKKTSSPFLINKSLSKSEMRSSHNSTMFRMPANAFGWTSCNFRLRLKLLRNSRKSAKLMNEWIESYWLKISNQFTVWQFLIQKMPNHWCRSTHCCLVFWNENKYLFVT